MFKDYYKILEINQYASPEEIKKAFEVKKYFPNLMLIVPTVEFSELCLNKEKLMHKLKELNISTIETKLGCEINENERNYQQKKNICHNYITLW